MLKRVSLAAAAVVLLGGVAVSLGPVPAEARSGCDARADALYPHNKNVRKAYKKACKDNHRAWKKRHDKGIWIII